MKDILLAASSISMIAACSVQSPPSAVTSIPEERESANRDSDVMDLCDRDDFLLPTEKERCEFRRDSCYDAFGGKSQICRRPFEQLLKEVKPAELVRTQGAIYKANGKVYFEGEAAPGQGPLVEILSCSCNLADVRSLCDEAAGVKAGVVGAYYTYNASAPVAG